MKKALYIGFVQIFVYLLTLACVWFFAWITNPDIDSGSVWFFGLIAGMILAAIGRDKIEQAYEEEFGR